MKKDFYKKKNLFCITIMDTFSCLRSLNQNQGGTSTSLTLRYIL